MGRILFYIAVISIISNTCYSQGKALSFKEAEKQGIRYQHLDSLYKNAIHGDTTLALFKTPAEQENFIKAYTTFLQDLGSFLNSNKFRWEKQTKCFNRLYIDSDGTVDYLLYNFPENEISSTKESEFDKLLNTFIQNHKFPIKAKDKFAQCSPVRYGDVQ